MIVRITGWWPTADLEHRAAVLRHGVRRVSFRTLAGEAGSPADLANRSLAKYRLIIEDFGGWDLFQELLGALSRIAATHGTDIASVATRAILERIRLPRRLSEPSIRRISTPTRRSAGFACRPATCRRLRASPAGEKGPAGDVYDLERDRKGAHGRIMKYELNALPERRGRSMNK